MICGCLQSTRVSDSSPSRRPCSHADLYHMPSSRPPFPPSPASPDFVDFRLLYHKILAVSECLPDVSQVRDWRGSLSTRLICL
jgi:hypothetical protein